MPAIVLALLILSLFDFLNAMESPISINEGERYELRCVTNLQYSVVWHLRQNDGTEEIFFGGEVSKPFKDMFLLAGNQSIGEYNLVISSADGRYAGSYKCIDDEGMGSELLSIKLHVIASTSPTYTPTVAQHAPDGANFGAPESAASRSENDINKSSFITPVSTVVPVVVVVAAIITTVTVVILRKKRDKDEKRNIVCLSKNVEAGLLSLPSVKEQAVRSDACDSNSLPNRDSKLQSLLSLPSSSSDSSEASGSSGTPLIRYEKEEDVV